MSTVRWLPLSHFQRESTIGSCPEDSNRQHLSNMAQRTLPSRPHSHLLSCLFGSLSIICNAWPTTSLTVPGPGPGLLSLQGSKSTGAYAPRGPRSKSISAVNALAVTLQRDAFLCVSREVGVCNQRGVE